MSEATALDALWTSQDETEETVEYEDGMGRKRQERVQAMPMPDLRPKGNTQASQRRLSVMTGGQHWAHRGTEGGLPGTLFDANDDASTNPGRLFHGMEKKRVATQVNLHRDGTQEAAEHELFQERNDLYEGYNPKQSRTPKVVTATRRGSQAIEVVGSERFSGVTVAAQAGHREDPLKKGMTDIGDEVRGMTMPTQRHAEGEFTFAGEDAVSTQMHSRVGSERKALDGDVPMVQKKGSSERNIDRRLFSIEEQHAALPGDKELSRWDAQNIESQNLIKRVNPVHIAAADGERIMSKFDSQEASSHRRADRFNDMAAMMASIYLPDTHRQFEPRDGLRKPVTFAFPEQAAVPTPQKIGPSIPRAPVKEETVVVPSLQGQRGRDLRHDYSHSATRIIPDVQGHTQALPADESRAWRSEDTLRGRRPEADRIPDELHAPLGEYRTPFKQDARDVSETMDRGMGSTAGVLMSSLRSIATKLLGEDKASVVAKGTTPRLTVQAPSKWTGHASRGRDGHDDGTLLQRKPPLASGTVKHALQGEKQLSAGRETPTREMMASFRPALPQRPALQHRGHRQ